MAPGQPVDSAVSRLWGGVLDLQADSVGDRSGFIKVEIQTCISGPSRMTLLSLGEMGLGRGPGGKVGVWRLVLRGAAGSGVWPRTLRHPADKGN